MEIANMIVRQLVNGLSLGSMYALIALGYTMVYGIVKLINFAHGDILMVGAYCGFFILTAWGTTPAALTAAFVFSMTVCALLAVVIERFAYRPLRNAPRLNYRYCGFFDFTKRCSCASFYRAESASISHS